MVLEGKFSAVQWRNWSIYVIRAAVFILVGLSGLLLGLYIQSMTGSNELLGLAAIVFLFSPLFFPGFILGMMSWRLKDSIGVCLKALLIVCALLLGFLIITTFFCGGTHCGDSFGMMMFLLIAVGFLNLISSMIAIWLTKWWAKP